MSTLLNGRLISVGYNPTLGQQFFDVLIDERFRQHIHSYFFSLTHQLSYDNSSHAKDSNINEIVDILKSCNTYDIPANLLLNTYDEEAEYKTLIDAINDEINLTAVTCVTLECAKKIKDEYPWLTIHLSVKYFDWEIEDQTINDKNIGFEDVHNIIHQKAKEIVAFNNKHGHIVDVVNISGAFSYNDFELMRYLKDNKIKNKFILNELCNANRYFNFRNFFPDMNVYCYNSNCGVCMTLHNEYNWTILTQGGIYKEQFDTYSDVDIFKLSSRRFLNIDELTSYLTYYTSPDPTQQLLSKDTIQLKPKNVPLSVSKIFLGDGAYKAFLEYLEDIKTCSRDCYSCQKCKETFQKMIKENFLL